MNVGRFCIFFTEDNIFRPVNLTLFRILKHQEGMTLTMFGYLFYCCCDAGFVIF